MEAAAPVGARGSGLRYEPGLDGLRALAVVAVLAFHDGRLQGGFLGVSTFFTLSGFLITTLVLVEHTRTGRVDLRAFWRRRFRRLLPAAVVATALVVVLVSLIGDSSTKQAVGGDAASSLLYIANWHLILSGSSYADLFTVSSQAALMGASSEPSGFIGLYSTSILAKRKLT